MFCQRRQRRLPPTARYRIRVCVYRTFAVRAPEVLKSDELCAELSGQGTWTDLTESKVEGASPIHVAHIFDLHDQEGLKDYLHGYLSGHRRLEGLAIGNVTKDIRMLVLGDSVDGCMAIEACEGFPTDALSRDNGSAWEFLPFHYKPVTCRHPHFVLRTLRIPGSSKDGPWHGYVPWESPFKMVQKVLTAICFLYDRMYHDH